MNGWRTKTHSDQESELSSDRVQSFSSSEYIQAKRNSKAHYINTVVCCQTHYYIPGTHLFSCCIAATKHFKNWMVQSKPHKVESTFACTEDNLFFIFF